jgi:hypothetical protein
MPLTTNYNLCATLQALQAYLVGLISQYLRKLTLLQRLASIIEQAGDDIVLPDIAALANLIPLGLLDAFNYNQIRCACPFLGLPALTAEQAELADLKNLVAQGYQALDQLFASHPYARLNQLQDELDSILAQIEQSALSAISPGMDVLACLEAICNALDQLQIYSTSFVNNTVGEFNTISNPNSTSSVLSGAQQAKASIVANGRATLQALGNWTPAPPPAQVTNIFS